MVLSVGPFARIKNISFGGMRAMVIFVGGSVSAGSEAFAGGLGSSPKMGLEQKIDAFTGAPRVVWGGSIGDYIETDGSDIGLMESGIFTDTAKHMLRSFDAFTWGEFSPALIITESVAEVVESERVAKVGVRVNGSYLESVLFASNCKEDRDSFPDYFDTSDIKGGAATFEVTWNLTQDTMAFV